MKRAFAYLLIFATISVLFGQDLDSQIEDFDERHDTNIKESTTTTLENTLGNFFGLEVEIEEK
ncbi:MAG: hypothetical protein IJN90_03315 [Bacilli bacterium]|nr:hypothetical protein [Bacilli bacterium]